MKLHPAQRAALIVAGVTSVPILWFIIRYTDPFSLAPWAEVRAVWEYAVWIDVGDGNGLVRWSARIWLWAVVIVLLYRQLAAAAIRTWDWIRSGS